MPDGNPAGATTERVDLPLQTRAATVQPASIDEGARTVELVWTTGAQVRRYDWMRDRFYEEELVVSPEAVDLARLNGGAALLDSHSRWGLDGILGVVERAWVEGGEGRAVVRFSERAEVEPIWADVRAGIIRNVSVGYVVRRFEIVDRAGENKLPLYRAVDWQPSEISLVAVGADAGAGVRAPGSGPGRAETFPCELTRAAPAQPQEATMTTAANPAGAAPANPAPAPEPTRTEPNPAPAPSTEEAVRAAVAAERTRATQIRQRCRAVGLDDAFAEELVARGVELAHVGDRIVDAIAARGGTATLPPRIQPGDNDHQAPDQVRAALVEAIAARATRHLPAAARIEPGERARGFMGHTILDALAEFARAAGHRVPERLPPAALYDHLTAIRTLSTSDFPIILADAGNKIMVKAYELAAPTFRAIFARKTFRDFRPHRHIRAGDFPALLEKGETAEFQYGAMSEAKNETTLATYGRIIGLSRRTLVNDDLMAFADLPAKAGRRVADFENTTAWAVLAQNSGAGPTIFEKNMPSGRPLFHADHANYTSGPGTVINVDNVGIGRAAMMKQTSLDGLKLNVTPRYLLTSPDKYTVAEQFCAVNIVAATDANANPFKGKLTPMADANLSGNAWHLFADPGDIETLIYGYLEGSEGPQLAVREGFTTDGMELRCFLDFAVGAVDYRGAYKNAGA